jgi:methionyl-tRNA formyltransferase
MRLVMMGTGLFAEPTFETILKGPDPVVGLVTQPDRAAGAARGSTRQTGRGMKAIAEDYRVPVIQPESINTPEGVAALRAFDPELLVVAAYGQILSREVLAVPPRGGINVHASLLPKYRGAAPIAWAIANGETTTGVTIIRMTVGLDAGDMLAQATLGIKRDETAGELEFRLAPIGAQLALDVVAQIRAGTTQGSKQDPALVTKAPKLTKEHGSIDWSQPAERIGNFVRAMQPWPTAYTSWHRGGQSPMRLLVYKTMTRPLGAGESGAPGCILLTGDARSLPVVAGADVVEILEVQPAGKRRMSAEDFLRGRRPQSGDRLGPDVTGGPSA